jgi:hypothetical protein
MIIMDGSTWLLFLPVFLRDFIIVVPAVCCLFSISENVHFFFTGTDLVQVTYFLLWS